ncbi:MAG: NUDIX domain-containing protein, partial [Caldilineae bacterium]
MTYFDARENEYGGIEVRGEALPSSPDRFCRDLGEALRAWEHAGYKVAWLQIPIARAALIPVAAEAGFHFHHTRPDYVMMVKALFADAFIPPYATHYVGAGGAVFNEQDELLVVVEKLHIRTRPQFFKLPGGLVEEGEPIVQGVMREVYEETGIRTRFHSLITIRHSHHWKFDKSALYFICRLDPLSSEIAIDEEEIAIARWMPVQEFLNNPHVHPFNKFVIQAVLGR